MGKVVLTYEQPGDIHSGKNKVIRAGGGGGTSDYETLSNKPSINSVELIGNKTSSDLGIIDVDQGIENAGKVLTVNSEGNVEPAEIPQPTIEVDASEVTYDGTVLTLEGDDVEEVLDSVDERFTQIGRLKYHLPEWTKTIKYIKVDTIDNYGNGVYFGEYADFVDVYPPDKNVYSEYFLNNVQYTYGYDTYKAGAFYSQHTNTPVQLCWTFNDFIDIEKTPYLLLYSDSVSEPYPNKKPTRLRFKFSEDNQIWNEFTVDITQMSTYHKAFSGAPSGYTTYFFVYIDIREFVGTDSTLIVNNTCKEISYQDYLALSDAEKMNGTAYYIPDLEIDNGEHRLDTTEKMVDIWYDGRPIYEKLFILDETIDIGVSQGAIVIADPTQYHIDDIIKGFCIGMTTSICAPEFYLNEGHLKAINTYPFATKYIILQYTKTNDTTLPEGIGRGQSMLADPIHTYDTSSEKFIGKWVDGKDIYEKTIEITGYTSFSRSSYDLTTMSDLDTIINAHCVILSENENGTDFYKVWNKKDTGVIRGESTGAWENISKVYFIIQYTKKQ